VYSVFYVKLLSLLSQCCCDTIVMFVQQLHSSYSRGQRLKVPERIQFRLCVLAYRCLIGTAPSYLAETLHSTADIGSRRRLRSASTSTLVIPTTRRITPGDRAFLVMLLEHGMLFRRLFILRHRCCSSAATSRRHCFSHRTLHHSLQLCDRL